SGIGGSSLTGEGLNSNDISSRLADATGGRSEGIFAPAYTEDEAVRASFLAHGDVRRTLEHAREADVAVVGVGDAQRDALVVRLGCISAEEMDQLRAN